MKKQDDMETITVVDSSLLDTKLTTPRLKLRFVSPEDATRISTKFTEEVATRWSGKEEPGTIASVEKGIDHARHLVTAKNKTLLDLVALDKSNNKLIGRCGIKPIEGQPKKYEVMLWTAPELRKNNYAIEMFEALVAWAKKHHIEHLRFPVTAGNVAAERLVNKLGLRLTQGGISTHTEEVDEEQQKVTYYHISLG